MHVKNILKTYKICLSITRRHSYKIHLAKIQQEHIAISRGPFTGPLEPSQKHVSWGPQGLSGGPGPLGSHCNSTTANIWSGTMFGDLG